MEVLDPDIVLRAEGGPPPAPPSHEVHGARAVAEQASMYSSLARFTRLALVNGTVGLVTAPGGRPFSVLAFTIRDGRIVELDVLADPARLAALDLKVLDG